jgi:hypothetical protein
LATTEITLIVITLLLNVNVFRSRVLDRSRTGGPVTAPRPRQSRKVDHRDVMNGEETRVKVLAGAGIG